MTNSEGRSASGCPSKYGMISLVTLVVQGCLHSLVLRLSRTVEGPRYLPAMAVIFTETLKILVCLAVLAVGCWRNSKSIDEFSRGVAAKCRDLTMGSLPMAVPATMYVMQQMLGIVAATHLDVVTFQICSQMKVFPTAIFASSLLGQHLSAAQWLSLPVLAGGVSLVTATGNSSTPSENTDWSLGVAACVVSGISSAFAGVYFEKYVKGMETSSLWIRNCQLSMYGLPLGILSLLVTDRAALMEDGPLQGFNAFTWGVVVLQAFGGIVVGMVVKYADNILKNFANALSVICTVLLAIPLFQQYPSPWSILGLLLTFTSIFMYGNSGPGIPVDICSCMSARNGEGGKFPLLLWDDQQGKEDGFIFSMGRFVGAGTVMMARAGSMGGSPHKGHAQKQESSISRTMRCLRYLVIVIVILLMILLVITTVHFSLQNSMHNGYAMWGRTESNVLGARGQVWALQNTEHPWRARLRVTGIRQSGH